MCCVNWSAIYLLLSALNECDQWSGQVIFTFMSVQIQSGISRDIAGGDQPIIFVIFSQKLHGNDKKRWTIYVGVTHQQPTSHPQPQHTYIHTFRQFVSEELDGKVCVILVEREHACSLHHIQVVSAYWWWVQWCMALHPWGGSTDKMADSPHQNRLTSSRKVVHSHEFYFFEFGGVSIPFSVMYDRLVWTVLQKCIDHILFSMPTRCVAEPLNMIPVLLLYMLVACNLLL